MDKTLDDGIQKARIPQIGQTIDRLELIDFREELLRLKLILALVQALLFIDILLRMRRSYKIIEFFLFQLEVNLVGLADEVNYEGIWILGLNGG